MPEDDVIDERHLIDLEESAEISFEDRVSIYWMENKSFLIGCITVLLLVAVCCEINRFIRRRTVSWCRVPCANVLSQVLLVAVCC